MQLTTLVGFVIAASLAGPYGQPMLGLDRNNLRNGFRIESEVGPDARTDLEHPARQPGQILPAQRADLLGLVRGDGGPDSGEERVVDLDRGR